MNAQNITETLIIARNLIAVDIEKKRKQPCYDIGYVQTREQAIERIESTIDEMRVMPQASHS